MQRFTKDELEYFMDLALNQAKLAYAADEVPVGSVIVKDRKIISAAHNLVNVNHDSTQHAEMLALQTAFKASGDWRLDDCLMIVTLEPCTMCIGAIRAARIPTLIIGAMDPRMGACGSIYDLASDARLGPVPRLISGIKADACAKIMSDFFKQKR